MKIGITAVQLLGVRDNVHTSQTNLGTLIANSMLDIAGADIALMNGGGIRDSIPPGDILKDHIFKVLPFGNYTQTIEVAGADIKAALENGVGKLPAPDGRYPHVTGSPRSRTPGIRMAISPGTNFLKIVFVALDKNNKLVYKY